MRTIAQFYALTNITLKFWAFGLFYTIVRFRHIGVDIGTGRQAIDVPALRTGTVVRVVKTTTMGMVVVLQVGDRFYAYCHLANLDLPDEGDVIKQGQRVGRLAHSRDPKSIFYGGTAWTGIHLHLVISNRADGAYRYPMSSGTEFHDPTPIIAATLNPTKPVVAGKPKTVYKTKQVATAHVNLRNAPSTKSRVLAVIPVGTVVLTGPAKDGWHPVKYGTRTGFVHVFYLAHRTKVVDAKAGLNLRATPGGRLITTLKNGTKVTTLAVQGKTDKARWWKVRVGTRTGWVDAKFLR